MSRFVSILAMIFVTGFAPASPSQAISGIEGGAGFGTLGMLIVTKEGMVLAADSRTTYGDGRHDDRAVKIFKLSEHAGCMIAGLVVQPPALGARGFDLPKEIQEVSGTPSLMDDPSVFENLLAMRFDAALSAGLVQAPPRAIFEDDPEVASVLVAGYSVLKGGGLSKIPDRHIDSAFKVKYLWGPEVNVRGGAVASGVNHTYSVPVRYYHVYEVDGPGPFAIFTNGNDQVLRDILRRKKSSSFLTMQRRLRDVDLAETQNNPQIKPYFDLQDRGTIDSMSLKQTVDLAEALIRENIRLAGDDLGIGGKVDIATITRDPGFQWVPGHAPASK